MVRRVCVGISLFSLCVVMLQAQDSRGSISGIVTDPSGGVVAGAKVTVTNTLTNEARGAVTNETGYYEYNFLEPSSYTVGVEASGFKKFRRSGLELNVGARLSINVTLEVGGVAETVEVTGEAPLLETASASGGRVLDNRQLVNLPFSDTNPFALSALAPGMQWTGQPEYRRPFDNGGTSAFNTAGGVGQNEYSIDGVSVTGTGRRVGFTPPSDSITEFKLETSNFDASQGFTSGATINVLSRSGSNALHGSLFNQHWQQRWNATQHYSRLLWENDVAAGRKTKDSQKQATGRSNNYSVTASGPVWIPKIYDGRNKLFWTVTFNGIKQSKAETTDSINRTVPTLLQRQGDFSALLTVPNGVNLYTVYDPRSAVQAGNRVNRTPFPGNKNVPILNPMAATYTKFLPTPNNVPGLVSAEGFINYYAVNMPKNEIFNSIVNRYDYVLGNNHRLNGRWQWNDRLANEYDWTYETALGLHGNGLTRINRGGAFSWLWTVNTTNILDMGGGVSRFEEGNRPIAGSPVSRTDFKPTSVGLPAYMDTKAGPYTALPRLDFNNYADFSDSYPIVGAKATTYDVRAIMTTVKGSHTWKYGWQGRRNDGGVAGPGNSSGIFTFRNNFVRRADNDTVSSSHALDYASYLMGLPTGISIDSNDNAYWQTKRQAFFFQDDWRISSKLRVSLGLRYEKEYGSTERYNRALVASFFPDLKQPFSDAVQAAYAANPITELPASQFRVLGGTRYLGQDGYDSVTKGVNWFLPKAGVVYSIDNKTVIRAGWGAYADTYNITNSRPPSNGYSQPTATVISTDLGLTFCCSVGAASNMASGKTVVNDPFPVRADGTRFDTPYRDALGYAGRFGQGYNDGNYSLAWDYKPAIQQRWRIGVQRELARNLMVDVSYNGSFSRLPQLYRIDALPQQYWATGNVRVQSIDDSMNTNVPNPFALKNLTSLQTSNPTLYRFISTQGLFTGSTMRKNTLLRPFGYFGQTSGIRPGDTFDDKRGSMRYTDVQILVERRYTKGLAASFMYTWTTSKARNLLLNEFDTELSQQVNNNARPHRVAITATYELPWGASRTWLKQGVVGHLVGNWNLGFVGQWQSGPIPGWGNRFFYGDLNQLGDLLKHDEVHGKDIHQWFDSSLSYKTGTAAIPSGFTGFEGRSAFQPGSYHVRVFPTQINSLREDGISNVDLKVERTFPIKPERGILARFSVDLLNALNHTNFGGPNTDPTNSNFGRVTSQRGLSRIIQFNLRVEF